MYHNKDKAQEEETLEHQHMHEQGEDAKES